MGVRGRASVASLSIVGSNDFERVERPAPPSELTVEQAEEWRAVVNRLPADWFQRETWGMLTQYCRHVVTARRVSQLITAAEAAAEVSIDELDRLYKMQEREGRAISSLLTRMRMTQQATYDKTKKKPLQSKRPWE
jgi:hypothetical protein